ncbi:unnamed protein product [Urochloa humidicola]
MLLSRSVRGWVYTDLGGFLTHPFIAVRFKGPDAGRRRGMAQPSRTSTPRSAPSRLVPDAQRRRACGCYSTGAGGVDAAVIGRLGGICNGVGARQQFLLQHTAQLLPRGGASSSTFRAGGGGYRWHHHSLRDGGRQQRQAAP